jgi:hypothetical protein
MKKLSAILFIALLSSPQLIFALVLQDKIIAIVNDKPITRFNILQAKKMMTLFNKVEVITPEIDEQLNKTALENLINQTLIQEQKQIFKIKVPKEEIQMAIRGIEANNGLPEGFLKQIFQEKNINYSCLEDKIEADVLFKKITQQFFISNILVDKNEVDNAVIASGIKNTNLALKIFISDNFDDNSYKNMSKLRIKLKNCDKLPKKHEYEKFATMQEITTNINQLEPLIRSTAQTLMQNQTSAVLKTDNHFKIIMVCGREIENFSEEESNFITNSIGNNKLSKQTQRFYTNLRRKAYIKIFGF